jgi:hypothetical protein
MHAITSTHPQYFVSFVALIINILYTTLLYIHVIFLIINFHKNKN